MSAVVIVARWDISPAGLFCPWRHLLTYPYLLCFGRPWWASVGLEGPLVVADHMNLGLSPP
jgi:hypothetical protein